MHEQESCSTPGAYWGKADNSGAYHLLHYHALDVAAVGVALLRQRDTNDMPRLRTCTIVEILSRGTATRGSKSTADDGRFVESCAHG